VSHPLTELLEGASGAENIENVRVTGVNSDSRAITHGDAFFALPGSQHHGDSFAAKAVERGARVVVSDRPAAVDPGVGVIVVDDVRRAYARAAARVAGPQPAIMLGITGTNGKTSIASFVRQIWQSAGLSGASIGTLGLDRGAGVASGALTTPDPLSLHRDLARLKADGCDRVIMEASSHGLDQRRMDGVRFDVVGFTNFSRDHLDYHADMDDYRDAKLRLFRELLKDKGAAVVNADDPEHMPFMFAALERGVTVMTVGAGGAFIEIEAVEREGWGQRVTGKLVGEPLDVHLPLAGPFQASNAMMAAAMAVAAGLDHNNTLAALANLEGARGRLERVATPNGAAIFIDYAHTPGALETALEALRPYATGKLRVVFGAGGDRDTGKRPMMGQIAARLADDVIVTDDNPRTEDAAAIRRAIVEGAGAAREIPGRADAIATAASALEEGDVLLIAGKGHEDYQIVGHTKHRFSDHEVVAGALRA